MNLFGPERIRDQFGIVYEIERIQVVDTALFGPCLEARARLPGDEAWDEGFFRLDKIEFLPTLEKAA